MEKEKVQLRTICNLCRDFFLTDAGLTLNKCAIGEVRVDPCPKMPCKVKRGRNVTIDFDFTPQFDATALENDVYWASPDGDLPWEGLRKDACRFVDCPLKKDQVNNYVYAVEIDKLAPPVSIFV